MPLPKLFGLGPEDTYCIHYKKIGLLFFTGACMHHTHCLLSRDYIEYISFLIIYWSVYWYNPSIWEGRHCSRLSLQLVYQLAVR